MSNPCQAKSTLVILTNDLFSKLPTGAMMILYASYILLGYPDSSHQGCARVQDNLFYLKLNHSGAQFSASLNTSVYYCCDEISQPVLITEIEKNLLMLLIHEDIHILIFIIKTSLFPSIEWIIFWPCLPRSWVSKWNP